MANKIMITGVDFTRQYPKKKHNLIKKILMAGNIELNMKYCKRNIKTALFYFITLKNLMFYSKFHI